MTARIFLLSHMRAYTSLLGHILGSHPAINGYYELHLSYTSAADLAKATQAYTAHDSLKPGSRYLFDKLLHNDYELNLAQLGLRDAVILCALRQAAPSIKSILHLFAKKSSNDLYAQPAEATKYYIQRLQTLAQFSQHYPRRYYYFDAELICADTPNMLDILRLWLQLDAPLESDYKIFSQTGVAGAGDSSPAIASGKVLNQTERYGDIVLAEDLSRQAIEAYQDCRFQLMTHARDVATH